MNSLIRRFVDGQPVKRSSAVIRETGLQQRGRVVIIRLEEGGKIMRFRLKGTRTWHTLAIERAFWMAVQATADEIKMLRKRNRIEKRRLREQGL
jgi:hypothetical protein